VLITKNKRIFITINSEKKTDKKDGNRQVCRFVEITDKFTKLTDNKMYIIIEVSCSKEVLCVLGNNVVLDKNIKKKSNEV
jgi:hypothetical protein